MKMPQAHHTTAADLDYAIATALSKSLGSAAAPEPVASSQRDVREQSPLGYLNGNIITFYRV